MDDTLKCAFCFNLCERPITVIAPPPSFLKCNSFERQSNSTFLINQHCSPLLVPHLRTSPCACQQDPYYQPQGMVPPQTFPGVAGPLPAQFLPGLLFTLGSERKEQLPNLPRAFPGQTSSQSTHQYGSGVCYPHGQAGHSATFKQSRD